MAGPERFVHNLRATGLLSNLVGTINGGSPAEPSYLVASNYTLPATSRTISYPSSSSVLIGSADPLSVPTTSAGKRKADGIEEQAGFSWTVFAGDHERGLWWMGKWSGEKLEDLARKDRSWHAFATRMAEAWAEGRMGVEKSSGKKRLILKIDHRGAYPVELELSPVSDEHARIIASSVAWALGKLHHGKIHPSAPSTPVSHRFSPSLPRSIHSPSSVGDWENASQATTQLSQVPENATVEQLKNAVKKRDAKIAKLQTKIVELKREKIKDKQQYRELLTTDKQRSSQVSSKLTGAPTLARTGFVPRDVGGRGKFGGGGDDSETESEDEGGADVAGPSASPTFDRATPKKV